MRMHDVFQNISHYMKQRTPSPVSPVIDPCLRYYDNDYGSRNPWFNYKSRVS